MKFSIVVPCYNEAQNLPLLLGRFEEVLQQRQDAEIILVNNGSTDDSARVLEELVPNYPFAKIVTVTKNQGYGFGILQGLQQARGEWVGWTHADIQTDPADVIRAMGIAVDVGGKVFIKGSRCGRPLWDQLFTWGMGIFESCLLGQTLWDINAQPNLFPRELLDTWKQPPHDFSLDLFALYNAKKQGFKTIRFPVRFPQRLHGVSHWNTGLKAKWKFIKRTLLFSWKLKRGL